MSFLFVLFHWVLFSSLMACLLIPLILLGKLAVKDKLSPSWHYFIWFLLLIRLILPVSPGSPLSILNVLPRISEIVQKTSDIQIPAEKYPLDHTEVTPAPANPQTFNLPSTTQILHNNSKQTIAGTVDNLNQKINIDKIALFIWLTGTICFGIYVLWLNGRWRQGIRASSQEAQEAEKLIFEQCQSLLNIHADLPLIMAPVVWTPGLIGFFRPALLLPLHLSEQINSHELKHIFLHELTHYQRKDYIVNGLMVLLKVIHWFNPLLWYAFYFMHEDCEIACDSQVLSRLEPEERSNYGYTIIHLMQIARLQRIPGMIGIMTKKSKMKKRIIMISLFKKSSAKSIALGSVLAILIGTIMLTSPTNSSAAQVTSSNESNSNRIASDKYIGKAPGEIEQADPAKTSTTASLIDISGQNFAGKFTGKVIVVPDPSKIEVGFSLNNSKPDKTTSELAKQNKAVGAINGGASKTASVFGPAISGRGFVINHGKVLFDDMKDANSAQDVAALTDQGKLIVGKHTLGELKKIGVQEAVSAGPSLIVNGVPQNLSTYFGVNSQTAIGQEADGTVLLLAINGRRKESMGATLSDVQKILLEHGAVNAALLDGGSLSTMYFQGNVVNNPPEGEQIVSSVFLVMP